jgi:uncharacterized protein
MHRAERLLDAAATRTTGRRLAGNFGYDPPHHTEILSMRPVSLPQISAAIGAALATIVATNSVGAQPAGAAAAASLPPHIVAGATGEARVTPDRAMLEISVQTRARTASEAAEENARKQRAVMDALRKQGLGADQLSTVNYNVYPEMQHDREGGEPRLLGYSVTNTVRAEVRKLDQVGALIDAALSAGANMITSLNFYASNTDQARRSALAAAVARARADAESMALAAGGSLGRLLELSTEPVQPPRPMMFARAGMAEGAAANTPIEAGQQTLVVSIVARWEYRSQ